MVESSACDLAEILECIPESRARIGSGRSVPGNKRAKAVLDLACGPRVDRVRVAPGLENNFALARWILDAAQSRLQFEPSVPSYVGEAGVFIGYDPDVPIDAVTRSVLGKHVNRWGGSTSECILGIHVLCGLLAVWRALAQSEQSYR